MGVNEIISGTIKGFLAFIASGKACYGMVIAKKLGGRKLFALFDQLIKEKLKDIEKEEGKKSRTESPIGHPESFKEE